MNSLLVTNDWHSRDFRENYRVTRRPMPLCTRRLPLCARSVCWGIFAPGQYEDRQLRPFVKILWSSKGTGLVSFGGRELPLRPGQIALFLPGTEHRARAGAQPWETCWWTMDGPLAAAIVAEFDLAKEGIYDAGPPPQALFDRLREALEDVSPQGESRASALAYELTAAAASHSRPVRPSPVVETARHILETEWSDPALDVTALALRLRLHRSSLSRRFLAAQGLSPSQYLMRVRLGHALSLLKQTSLPVKEIALRCGFGSQNYFARIFRQTQQLTPRQWRQS